MPTFVSSGPPNKVFAAVVGLSIVAFWQPLWTLAQFTFRSEQYSHILLIPFVSILLLYQERARVFSQTERNWALGGAVLGLGALAFVLSQYSKGSLSENDGLSFSIVSVVLVWIGLFLMFCGKKAFRAAAFPLCFLFLMVPIPDAVLESTIRALQLASAEVTAVLFSVTGIPVFRQGIVFALPNVTIEVAKECSGIRSSLVLFITGLLAGHLFLRSWSRKFLLYAAVFPITVFKNGLRIVTLSVLAVYVDPAILDSTAHRRGGIPFFGLALVFLGAILWLLRRKEPVASPSSAELNSGPSR